jgi:hypothetical protein
LHAGRTCVEPWLAMPWPFSQVIINMFFDASDASSQPDGVAPGALHTEALPTVCACNVCIAQCCAEHIAVRTRLCCTQPLALVSDARTEPHRTAPHFADVSVAQAHCKS